MSKKQRKVLQAHISIELWDAIKEIADHEEKSVSQMGREILEAMEPGILHARDMMRAAQSMTAEARKALLPDLERHEKHLEESVKYGLENIETTLKNGKVDPPQHKLPI
jgi:hypothetical protein